MFLSFMTILCYDWNDDKLVNIKPTCSYVRDHLMGKLSFTSDIKIYDVGEKIFPVTNSVFQGKLN